jgi:hypothetical protein
MKMQIRSQRSVVGDLFWIVDFNGAVTVYHNVHAAQEAAFKRYKRWYKENGAFSRLSKISDNLLSVEEYQFIQKMRKSKCKGITKAQYGYLVGIYDRQQREW